MNKIDFDITKSKILIADDVALMRDLLKGMLRGFGYVNIDEACNGEGALQRFMIGRHNLVILDINMPKQNGIDTVKAIRAVDPLTFIIMISGNSAIDIVTDALASGINGYIVKPYTPKKLAEILGKYAEHTALESTRSTHYVRANL